MADVQLERGYVRVANRLDEAITCADFTVTQMKIVRAIIRLTWGWRQRSVLISAGDLAARCGLKDSGGFRRDLRLLVANDVVREVERGHGRTPSAYAMNKNFEQWGVYAVPLAKLAALFDERLPSLDSPPPSGQATDDTDDVSPPPSSRQNGNSAPPPGRTTEAPGNLSASMESGLRLHGVTLDPPNSFNGETYERGKKGKTVVPLTHTPPLAEASSTRASEPPATAAAVSVAPTNGNGNGASNGATEHPIDPDHVHRYAIGIATAINQATTEKFGEQPMAIHFARCEPLAVRLIAEHVDLDVARSAIARKVHQAFSEPPRSVNYFHGCITDAHQSAEQKQLDATTPKADVHRGGQPTRIGPSVADRNRETRDRLEGERLKVRHGDELRAAGLAWGKDPDNAAAYLRLVERANAEFAEFGLDRAWVQRSRDSAVITESARASGFPVDFDDWKKNRDEFRGKAESEPKVGVTVPPDE